MEGRTLFLSYRSPVSDTWEEREVKVYKVRRVDHELGKTGKGVIVFWQWALAANGKHYDGSRPCGQNTAVDIEDIVTIR